MLNYTSIYTERDKNNKIFKKVSPYLFREKKTGKLRPLFDGVAVNLGQYFDAVEYYRNNRSFAGFSNLVSMEIVLKKSMKTLHEIVLGLESGKFKK